MYWCLHLLHLDFEFWLETFPYTQITNKLTYVLFYLYVGSFFHI